MPKPSPAAIAASITTLAAQIETVRECLFDPDDRVQLNRFHSHELKITATTITATELTATVVHNLFVPRQRVDLTTVSLYFKRCNTVPCEPEQRTRVIAAVLPPSSRKDALAFIKESGLPRPTLIVREEGAMMTLWRIKEDLSAEMAESYHQCFSTRLAVDTRSQNGVQSALPLPNPRTPKLGGRVHGRILYDDLKAQYTLAEIDKSLETITRNALRHFFAAGAGV